MLLIVNEIHSFLSNIRNFTQWAFFNKDHPIFIQFLQSKKIWLTRLKMNREALSFLESEYPFVKPKTWFNSWKTIIVIINSSLKWSCGFGAFPCCIQLYARRISNGKRRAACRSHFCRCVSYKAADIITIYASNVLSFSANFE